MTPARQRNLVTGLIIIGLIIAGFFGLRAARVFRQFREHRPPPLLAAEHAETDVNLIRDWMTIPFIARIYRVPPNLLFDALEIPAHRNQEKSLKQLNEEYFPKVQGIVLEKIKATVLAALANQQQEIQVVPNTPVVP
jgi:hypothetical protein